MATDTRPLRKDAERNRQRILEAARRVFGERGLGVTLDDIAHEAGVGVGTVYRRFADKEELIDAVFEERIDEVMRRAEEGLAMDDPWDGLVHFLTGGIECQLKDRALRELLLSTKHGRERVTRSKSRVRPLAEKLLRRAQEAGAVRDDLAPTDLPILQSMVLGAVGFTDHVDPELWRRGQTVLLDGLRPARAAPTALSCRSMTDEQLECAMRGAQRER